MSDSGWRVCLTPGEVLPRAAVPDATELALSWDKWLQDSGMLAGTPFLLCRPFDYDVELNAFFRSAAMVGKARTTQLGYARNIAAFLTFLGEHRGQRGWRDAEESDHLAYWKWRRMDSAGPQVSGNTWDREVAAMDKFYGWQVQAGHLVANPIPHRPRHRISPHSGFSGRGSDETTPATYSHDRVSERIEWLPPEAYRRWRDVGVCGYGVDGLPDRRFRGRWAARNAVFCDLMVRTGMRLSEQASLTVFEVPLDSGLGGYQRFWLPAAIAKGDSARRVYVPDSIVRELVSYNEVDRSEVIEQAQAADRYRLIRRPLVVMDPSRSIATYTGAGVRSPVKVANLGPEDRRRLLIDGVNGLEPAAFWLSEVGTPMAVSTWKGMFAAANARCGQFHLPLSAHAHMLRHTFAVVTLEQLQRGHIEALTELNPHQRRHWTQVFGDPLDWVRRRLGHRSSVTTQIYLHALGELEMETRAALVPSGWDDPPSISRPQRPGLDVAGVFL